MIKKLLIAMALLSLTGRAMAINLDEGFDKGKLPANQITVDTSNFSKNLSSADKDVQHALETIDALVLGSAETDPYFIAWKNAYDHHGNWDTAYSWGNPSGVYLPIAGTAADSAKLNGQSASYYLHSFTEADPVVAAINGIVKSNGTLEEIKSLVAKLAELRDVLG